MVEPPFNVGLSVCHIARKYNILPQQLSTPGTVELGCMLFKQFLLDNLECLHVSTIAAQSFLCHLARTARGGQWDQADFFQR
jgi:hypothetical protein